MSVTVSVVDYGMGNLYSVTRALERSGAQVVLCDTRDAVLRAECLVLPGVGAFADGMAGLQERGLDTALIEYGQSSRPLLGICLGMQMLFTASEEFGEHPGLGLIPGRVRAIPGRTVEGIPQKIPHIGWCGLVSSSPAGNWQGTILEDVQAGDSTYFVHSYAVVPERPMDRLADCVYGGHQISAVVRAGQIYGCQFHPEKSGPVGLAILRRYLALPR
jgi:glutamine amidotransferase